MRASEFYEAKRVYKNLTTHFPRIHWGMFTTCDWANDSFHVWKASFVASHWLGFICVQNVTIWLATSWVYRFSSSWSCKEDGNYEGTGFDGHVIFDLYETRKIIEVPIVRNAGQASGDRDLNLTINTVPATPGGVATKTLHVVDDGWWSNRKTYLISNYWWLHLCFLLYFLMMMCSFSDLYS